MEPAHMVRGLSSCEHAPAASTAHTSCLARSAAEFAQAPRLWAFMQVWMQLLQRQPALPNSPTTLRSSIARSCCFCAP